MPPGYTQQIYNSLVQIDPSFKSRVSFESFKSGLSDVSYSQQIYNTLNKADNSFQKRVSFDDFREGLGYSKKKVTTASNGGGGTKPSSSASLSKAVSSGVQKVVESAIKPDGSYRYPGREDALYKKTNNQWFIDAGKTGKYVKINEQKRIDALETYAKKYTADIAKPAMDVVKDVAKGATQLIDKATAPSSAELQKDVKKEIDYLESQKELSNKEMADIFGWSEADVERVSKSSGKTLTPPSKTAAANVSPIINTNAQPAIEQMSQNMQRVINDVGINATEEKKQERLEYYNTRDLQTYLKDQGYDVDVNGDKEDKKTQSATKHLNMTEKIFIDDMYESMDQSDRVSGLVNENMLSMSEEEAVPLLRKYFSKDGFKFNETGLGNYIEVISPGKKKQTFEFNTDDPDDINKLRTFLSDTYLAKNEKQKYRDLLEGDDIDMDDPRARDKYFYDLVTLIGKNPDKYADIIGDPDNILSSTHPIKNAIDRTAYNAKAESIQLNKDYEALKIRIDRYNANPEQYGPKEKAAINNTLHDLKVREYKLLGDYKKLSSMDNSLRRITGRKILESKQSGDWAGVLTSTLFKGVTALPLLSTQVAMDILPYAVGAENFFDPITYNRLKDVDGYTDLEIEDLGAKKLKQTIYGDLERGIMNVGSSGTTTPEYINDPERNDILKGLSFMAESVGTALASGGSGTLQKLGFFAMSYNGMEKEMMDPRFDDMSESEKKLYSVPYGFVIGALERFGYNALSGGDKSLVNRFATGIIGRTLAGLPKDATISSIKREINKNVGKMIANGVVNVTGGALAEGTTEGLQKVFEIGEKYAINQIKDKEYFQGIPDLSTWEGIKETYNLAKEDAYLATIGALVFSSGTNSLQTMQQHKFNGKTDAQFEALYNSVSNPFLRSMTELDIKTRLSKGEINKEEAASQIQALNDVAGRLSRINPNLDLRDKKESFNLILEKEQLEKEKAPLDIALQTPYNVRINEINDELKTIANNAFQKQTTSEVPVQPEAAVGGEVAQGEPQAEPQVATQEGGQAIEPTSIQEEVTPVQEEVVTEQQPARAAVISEAINRPATLSSFGGSQLDTPLSGDVYVEGQQVVFEDRESGRIYELGNVDEVMNSEIPGLELQEERVTVTPQGQVSIDGNNWNIQMELPTQGIEYNPAGEVMTVSLKDDTGKTQMFRGQDAVDIAYQIELQKIQTPEQQQFINDLLEQDEEFQTATESIQLPEVTAPVQETAVEVPVQAQPAVEPTAAAQPTAVEVTPVQPTEVAVTPVQPVAEVQPTEAQPVVEAQPAQEVDEELEALRTLLQGTDEQIDEQVAGLDISDRNDKVAENIANAAKAVSQILPDVQFIVHDTDESYRQAAGETDRKQSSRGTYIPATENTPAQIHINSTRANNRTAAHEVFHAVLLNAVKSDDQAQRLTKRMIEAVMKSMGNIEGQQGLKKYLFDFAANYEENVRNEEKLAELLGVLATNYKKLDAPTKGIIKRFFERIAKFVGLKPMTDKEVVDFMNTMADALGRGEVLTNNDIKAIKDGASSFISAPTLINKLKRKQKSLKLDDNYELSFVTKNDVFDIEALINDIHSKNQKVWFWVADQLGRGMYYDSVIGKEHYLDAGPSYALDPDNKAKNIIWASGKSEKELNRYISSSDYIFIISGSPIASKFFNVRVIELLENRITNFNAFKNDVLNSNPVKAIKEIFEKHDSWESIKQSPDRKKLLNAMEDVKTKKSTSLKSVFEQYNAFIDPDSLRDGFYKENDFKMNDIMLVLKPTSVGGKSAHSTYENDILGEVIGVPNKKINAFDILPEDIKEKYSQVTAEAQKSQVIAPYGAGIRQVSARKQQPARGITQIINTARNAGFSDAKIEKYLREEGYTDAEIQQSLYGISTTMGIDEIFERSNKALQRKFDDPAYVRALRYVNKLIFERQEGIKRLIKGINNKDASRVNAMLVTKSGATGFASERFKEAENKIYGRLGGVSPQQRKENRDTLDKMIYVRRFIAINENRRKRGEEPYIGMGGYNEERARQELEEIRQKIGQKKFDNFSKRADLYFAEYKESLKMLYDSGRINKGTYESLKDIDYSPIRVIKYIIDDNADPNEVESQANRLGVSRKDIQTLRNINENEIILDSRWLLMLNIHSVAARAFENKMLNSFASALNNATQEETEYLDRFIKRNPIIGTKQDGTPKQKYNMMNTPVGYTPVVYFDKGIQKVLVVKDEYAQQLLDIKNIDSSLRFLAALTLGNVLRYFATVGNPLFIIGNVPVDIINAAFFTDVYSPFKPIAVIQATTGLAYRFLQDMLYDVAPLYESIRKIFSKDKTNREYRNRVKQEYITHGGAMGTMAEEGIRSLERGYLLARGVEKNTRKTLITVGKATSYLGSKSEIAMRLAVYNKRKKNLIAAFKKEHGQMPNEQELDDIMWEATREARELIDFSQGGEFVKKADQIIPYLNAATQGLRKQGKFAVENKYLFASNVLQAMGMFAGIAAYSLANAYAAFSDDEEDKDKLNKKVTDAIDSISEHEKAQFHIIFTGRKVVVDGKVELEYIRIKKLPFFSIATSYAEQYAMRYWINKNGGKYDIDNKLMRSIILKSLPLLPQEIASRNPMVAALIAYNFNYDFFTKKEIVRNLNELNIRPESEGMYDKKVEDFYKILAPKFGLSPKRTKAAVEKIITAPSTNPAVHILYAAMNGVFSDKTSLSEDIKIAGQMIMESATKKMVRTTDHEILRYAREDKYKEEVRKIKTEINEAQQKVNSLINDKLEKGEKYTSQELMKIVEENFPKYDREKYFKKYKTKMMFPDLDKEILDIVYEEEPRVQALKLYGRYGNALEEDEKAELIKVMRSIKKKISPKVFRIYNEEYKNR